MRRFIEDIKMKNIAFILLFFLLVSGHTNANAVGGTVGGWRITSNVAQGIGAKITATKDVIINGASRAVTSSATVLPKAVDVGKFLGKNGSAAAVVGVVDLLLDGVDWVMDPANNTVKFHEKVQDQKCDATSCASLLNIFQINNYTNVGTFSTIEAAATHYAEKIISGVKSRESWTCSKVLWNTYKCEAKAKNEAGYNISVGIDIVQVSNPNYDQSKEEERKKTVPLSDIGQQVIDLAETEVKTGNPAVAVPLTRAVAQDMIQEAESDDTKARPISTELDKNVSYPSDTDVDGTVTTPEVVDPTTGEVVKPAESSSISLKFPEACKWFPQVCEFIDWVKTDPEVESEMDVPEKEIDQKQINKNLIKINSRNCPADIQFDVSGLPFGISINKGYSMQEICSTVEPLKYVFQLITAVICALILLRV